jgi:NAD+ synthase (glutamine-hydrolysing)
MAACDEAVQTVARETAALKDLVIVVGHPVGGDARGPSVTISERHNAASVICNGQVAATYAKQRLPNYQVFDERRYFVPGRAPACSTPAACAWAC